MQNRTVKISFTSLTRSQSPSDNWKALHGILFVTRPFTQTVVIRPNIASAEARTRLMGLEWEGSISKYIRKCPMMAHLMQMIGTAQHIMSGAPSNIAVEWNSQRVIDLALNL